MASCSGIDGLALVAIQTKAHWADRHPIPAAPRLFRGRPSTRRELQGNLGKMLVRLAA
jgi:hypothetical protein